MKEIFNKFISKINKINDDLAKYIDKTIVSLEPKIKKYNEKLNKYLKKFKKIAHNYLEHPAIQDTVNYLNVATLAHTFFIAIAAASLPIYFLFPAFKNYMHKNTASPDLINKIVIICAICLTILFLVYFIIFILKQKHTLKNFFSVIKDVNQYGSFLIIIPFILGLSISNIESSNPILTLNFLFIISIVLFISFYQIPKKLNFDTYKTPSYKFFTDPLLSLLPVIIMFLLYGFMVSHYTITNHRLLHVSSFDLALYDNLVWNTSRGYFLKSTLAKGGVHMSAHFDPILLLLSPIYWIRSDAETLLAFQAFWIASGAIPLFLIAKKLFKLNYFTYIFPFVYLFHPALSGMNMYEFHSLALSIPIFIWIIYFLELNNLKLYFSSLVLLLLVREDMSLVAMFFCAVIFVGYKRYKLGLASLGVVLTYLFITRYFIMPDPSLFMKQNSGSIGHSYRSFFADMMPTNNDGASRFFITLATNPIFILRHALSSQKIIFFLQLTMPLLFLPFFAKRKQPLFFYGFIYTMLATKTSMYSIYYHNISVLLPMLAGLTPYGAYNIINSDYSKKLKINKKSLYFAFTCTMLITVILFNWKFGAFFENKAFRMADWHSKHHVNMRKIPRYYNRYKTLRFMLDELIPKDASVAASYPLMSFASSRKNIHYSYSLHSDYLLFMDNDKTISRLQPSLKNGTLIEVLRKDGLVLYKQADK